MHALPDTECMSTAEIQHDQTINLYQTEVELPILEVLNDVIGPFSLSMVGTNMSTSLIVILDK